MHPMIRTASTEYEMYMRDESRKSGSAEHIAFPGDINEAAELIRSCSRNNIPVTLQGARTGVGGGAVPQGGCVISLERMRKLEISDEGDRVTAGPGISLKEMNSFIQRKTGDRFFFPPDPTEGTASVGGIVSCNSSGARTYGYGPVRNYVSRIKVILFDGSILDLERGRHRGSGRVIKPSDIVKDEEGKRKYEGILRSLEELKLPEYRLPRVKNAAGYYIYDDMDPIDLFIGSEGTLGLVAEVEFKLEEKPKLIWGAIAFFLEEDQGISFAEIAEEKLKGAISLEFFDLGSLKLLTEKQAEENKPQGGGAVPEGYAEGVFTELTADSREEMLENIRVLEECVKEAGGDPVNVRIAGSSRSFRDFKELRHATPEAVNARVAERKRKCSGITKLGSDMSVPKKNFRETVRMYREDVRRAGLEYVMFGHIGNHHLHVNIISRDMDDYAKGKKIFAGWAEMISGIGGSVSAEHGVGKLKRDFLKIMYKDEGISQMRELKRALDPDGILNRDDIFIWEE